MKKFHWFDNAAELFALGSPQPTMNATEMYAGPFPMVLDELNPDDTPGPRQSHELVSSRIYQVKVGADVYAAVVLCRIEAGKPQWTVYCGDEQADGKQTLDGKTLAGKMRADAAANVSLANMMEASGWVNSVPDQNTGCGFWRMLARGLAKVPAVVKICPHTQIALSLLQESDLKAMATEVQDWKDGKVAAVVAPTGPLSPEEEAFHDAAFIQHVLLAGERGAGKSWLARAAAAQHDAVYLEMQMHPSMEAWEFRAHDRAWNGKVYTVLGKLAEAVYWIQQGKKVILCMDEFLNMNPLYTTAINSPLTLTDDDHYIIETGRIIDLGDGIGQIETVKVPADKFWVVATTNIGARYNLDKMAPSVRARFQIILMNTNPERTKTILEKTLAKYGMPLAFAEMFKKFIEAANQAVAENTLDEEATTRLACNVVRAVHLKAKRDRKSYPSVALWLPVIKKQLLREIAQVVNFELGPLDVEQELHFKGLVDASFK